MTSTPQNPSLVPRFLLGGLLLAAALPAPVQAQEAARMEAVERQLRALQAELTRLRREAATREAEARQAAARTQAEVRETRQRLETAPVVAAARRPRHPPRPIPGG